MENKRKESYKEIFKYFKNELNLHFNEAMLDFELGLKNALKEVFQDIKLMSCWFHFAQAVTRKLQHMPASIRFRYDIKELIAKLLSLPLLPASKIYEAYQTIKKEILLTESENVTFRKFFLYFESFWLYKIGPANFSVFDLLQRTNNNSESFNKQLNDAMETKHSNMWMFLGTYFEYCLISSFNQSNKCIFRETGRFCRGKKLGF